RAGAQRRVVRRRPPGYRRRRSVARGHDGGADGSARSSPRCAVRAGGVVERTRRTDHDDVTERKRRFSLASAFEASRDDERLARWVWDFLASRGSGNAVLAAGLAQAPHWWLGPVSVAV